jgi:hypothetical protein
MLKSGVKILVAAGCLSLLSPTIAPPAEAARYSVYCAAPNGSWCRIYCANNTGVACYANVVNGQCVKRCIYR